MHRKLILDFVKKFMCVFTSICIVLPVSPCYAGKNKKKSKATTSNLSVSFGSSSQSADVAELIELANTMNSVKLHICPDGSVTRRISLLKSTSDVERVRLSKMCVDFTDFVSGILADPTDVKNHIAGIKFLNYSIHCLQDFPEYRSEEEKQRWYFICGMWINTYRLLRVSYKYLDKDLHIPPYEEWHLRLFNRDVSSKVMRLNEISEKNDYMFDAFAERDSVHRSPDAFIFLEIIICNIAMGAAENLKVSANPTACGLDFTCFSEWRPFCIYPEYAKTNGEASLEEMDKWMRIGVNLEYPNILEMVAMNKRMCAVDSFGDFLAYSMWVFTESVSKFEDKLVKKGGLTSTEEASVAKIRRGISVAKTILHTTYDIGKMPGLDPNPAELIEISTNPVLAVFTIDEFFDMCRMGEFLFFPFNNFYSLAIRKVAHHCGKNRNDIITWVVRRHFDLIRQRIDKIKATLEQEEKKPSTVCAAGDDKVVSESKKEPQEAHPEAKQSLSVGDEALLSVAEQPEESPQKTDTERKPQKLPTTEDIARKIARDAWKKEVEHKRSEKQELKRLEHAKFSPVISTRPKVFFLCKMGEEPLEYLHDHKDMPYESYWQSWLKDIYNNNLSGNTAPLPKFSCARFFHRVDGAPEMNIKDNVYEYKKMCKGATNGLRIVYYIEKGTNNIIIIYLGAPFGVVHKNEISTIEIDSDFSLQELPEEYKAESILGSEF